MRARLFSLVNANDSKEIFAWGIDLGDEAVTYRREPDTGQTSFGVHDSAQSALDMFGRIADMRLVWSGDPDGLTMLFGDDWQN